MGHVTYEGNEAYIFISYAHRDSARVIPIIQDLQARGFRVWYDAGIEAGTEWPEYIAERLMNSACVVAFMSEAARDSHNCRREINFAIHKRKDPLVVYLEDVVLPLGMEMQLGTLQALFRQRFTDEKSFIDALAKAQLLQPCLNTTVPDAEQNLPGEIAVTTEDAYKNGQAAYNARKYEEAVRWFSAAANEGHADAQYSLGFCYARGIGVQQSRTMAFMWYKKAADAGHMSAINRVAWTYAFSAVPGVKRNKEEAIRLFLINAKRGDKYAIRQLEELGYKFDT